MTWKLPDLQSNGDSSIDTFVITTGKKKLYASSVITRWSNIDTASYQKNIYNPIRELSRGLNPFF